MNANEVSAPLIRGEPLDVVAVIPARGGSKRVPRKNVLPLRGLPVLAYSVLHARASRHVSAVYVSTDDVEAAAVARRHGAEVIDRPDELAGDTASSESAVLHVLDQRRVQGLADPDLVVFLQCTSPVRRPEDIDGAVDRLLIDGADSLFSACENSRLIWGVGADGAPHSINYDHRNRKREQVMERQYRENGSIYVFRPTILRSENNRLGGRMTVYEMDYWSSFQIDTPEHMELIEWVLGRPEYRVDAGWPERLDLVAFDFDGVMTDNAVLVGDDGRETVRCHRGDGWGLARLRDAGVAMMVLSTETNPVVAARCAKLKIPCHQGIGDKGAYLERFLAERSIDPAHVAFVGNDVNDLGCLRRVGFPVAVADSHPEVLAVARMVLTRRGGDGAVREFCDLARGRFGRRD